MGFLLVLITVEYNTTTYKTDIIMNGHFGWCCIINGTEGIGNGWQTKIPKYNPREIRRTLNKNGSNPPPTPPTKG
ncbi:DNA topoisomerase 2-beta [Dermatophagoides farinae]|uniref:DNA topoisomerase 2-beta n=1 Tax=Dermatophagoides farinae TaxID=6954 RepID=A0A922KZ10_DERFA|nr:DNA topoisomerase 2-beta [Dermatophagoides farinae]